MKIEQQAQTRAFLIQSFGSVRVGRYTACSKHSCPWLCRLFCDADNIRQAEQNRLYIYKKLSTGGDCCGFHFFKKQSTENH